MFENAIWKDVLRWSEKAVGTKPRFIFLLLIHLLLFLIAISIFTALTLRISGHTYFHPFYIFLFVTIVLMPAMYLFALRKLLAELKKHIPNR